MPEASEAASNGSTPRSISLEPDAHRHKLRDNPSPTKKEVNSDRVFRIWPLFRSFKEILFDDIRLRAFIVNLRLRANHYEEYYSEEGNIPLSRRQQAIMSLTRERLDNFYEKWANKAESTSIEEAWADAYHLESELARIIPADELLGDLRRVINLLTNQGVKSVPTLEAELNVLASQCVETKEGPPKCKQGCEAPLRALAVRCYESLHWEYLKRLHSIPVQQKARWRITIVGIFALACFLFTHAHLVTSIVSEQSISSQVLRMLGMSANPDNRILIKMSPSLPIAAVFTAGLFGVVFSRLLYFQKNIDKLPVGEWKDLEDWATISLRCLVGVMGALTVMFFLQSGIIKGEVFPDFDQLHYHVTKKSPDARSANSESADKSGKPPEARSANPESADELSVTWPIGELATLVMWSFIAGFSERFVPRILRTTETTLEASFRKR
ncbi:hypothetical protein [Microvirga massiliensis]|uniref:hypothetical protein n=1 Tax=Microvirga massiliensis TaxID=1033741 RepID=UPI000B23F49E|nr:hypothetical protein [Microvirga massiliensis]